jgi:hypothetical protein
MWRIGLAVVLTISLILVPFVEVRVSAHRDHSDRSIVISRSVDRDQENRHRDHRDRRIVIRALAEA